jgi:hypothetical protein
LKTLERIVEEDEKGRSNLLLPEGVLDEEDDVESAETISEQLYLART